MLNMLIFLYIINTYHLNYLYNCNKFLKLIMYFITTKIYIHIINYMNIL